MVFQETEASCPGRSVEDNVRLGRPAYRRCEKLSALFTLLEAERSIAAILRANHRLKSCPARGTGARVGRGAGFPDPSTDRWHGFDDALAARLRNQSEHVGAVPMTLLVTRNLGAPGTTMALFFLSRPARIFTSEVVRASEAKE